MADKVDSYFNILGSKRRLFFLVSLFWESDSSARLQGEKLESWLGLLLLLKNPLSNPSLQALCFPSDKPLKLSLSCLGSLPKLNLGPHPSV